MRGRSVVLYFYPRDNTPGCTIEACAFRDQFTRFSKPQHRRPGRRPNFSVLLGSKAALPKVFDLGNPRIMTSTEALEVEGIAEDLLVVGGGYIGMEWGRCMPTWAAKWWWWRRCKAFSPGRTGFDPAGIAIGAEEFPGIAF